MTGQCYTPCVILRESGRHPEKGSKDMDKPKDKGQCRKPKTCGDNGWEDMCRPCRDGIDRWLGMKGRGR